MDLDTLFLCGIFFNSLLIGLFLLMSRGTKNDR